MRWQDREGSNNIEDARGSSGGGGMGGGKPIGIIGLIILLIGAYNGVDLSGLVGGANQLSNAQQQTRQQPQYSQQEQQLYKLSSVVLRETEKYGARIFKKWAKRIKSLCYKFIRAQLERDVAQGKPAQARFIALRIISYTLICRFTIP